MLRSMAGTPETGKDEFSCPYCAAVYDMTVIQRPSKQSGFAVCQVCEKRMTVWNGQSVPHSGCNGGQQEGVRLRRTRLRWVLADLPTITLTEVKPTPYPHCPCPLQDNNP